MINAHESCHQVPVMRVTSFERRPCLALIMWSSLRGGGMGAGGGGYGIRMFSVPPIFSAYCGLLAMTGSQRGTR